MRKPRKPKDPALRAAESSIVSIAGQIAGKPPKKLRNPKGPEDPNVLPDTSLLPYLYKAACSASEAAPIIKPTF